MTRTLDYVDFEDKSTIDISKSEISEKNISKESINPSSICKENSSLPEKLGRVGFIGRFEPLHLGGAILLEVLCRRADHVTIGIGSSNKYNYRNPYTAKEREEMLHSFLAPKYNNYSIVKLQDYGHITEYSDGKKWVADVKAYFGKLDYFITGNEYVKNLLKDEYKIIHPSELLCKNEQILMRSTDIRILMSYGNDWKKNVPEEINKYIIENDLDKRFRREFALETLEKCLGKVSYDNLEKEKENVKIVY